MVIFLLWRELQANSKEKRINGICLFPGGMLNLPTHLIVPLNEFNCGHFFMETNQKNLDYYNRMERVIRSLYQYALLLTNDPEIAEKLVYDSIRQVLSAPERPEEIADLYKVLCHTLETFFTRGYQPCGNSGNVHLKWGEVQLCVPEEIRVSGVYDLKQLNRILSLLTEKTRILYCLWQTRCPCSNIANRMRLREGTVKKQIFHIRKILKKARIN